MSKELDELKLQMEKMQKKIEELENKEKEQTADKWWIPKFGEDYWYIDYKNSVYRTTYSDLTVDKSVIDSLNYFKTKEQAERKAFEQLLHRKLEKFAYENNEEEIEWNDNCQIEKYYIYYDFDYKVLEADFTSEIKDYSKIKDYGQIYFSSSKIAEKAIEEFKEDLIRYFTTNK